ncbi:MAG: aromatic amino acid aminotransferase [Clostridiales bacterium]|nr:aromatic amino acid aminotransferase [Clostridiales bacterium]
MNKNVREIQISGIRKFYNLLTNYKDAISLTLGQPDFNTPEHIKIAAKAAIDNNKTIYTPNAGLAELREAASQYFKNKYLLSYNVDTEIIVTNGASEAIDIALRTILEKGCEVILPGPIYPGYEPIIRLCGATPIYIDTTNTGFKLNAAILKEKITDKTRCIILPYPSNPTGCILDHEDLTEISKLLLDKDIFILSDEIYSELNYKGKHLSIATYPGMREKTILINGLSKSHSMTGWRIGFTMAPEYITKNMIKVHQYNATCACSISQYAALEALVNGIDDAAPMKIEYTHRRDFTYKRLVAMGLEVVKPEGAFYIFPSIKQFSMTSFDFAFKLLDEARVAVVPGDAFSNYGQGYVRLSYACSMDVLKEGLDRMEGFIKKL